MLSLLSLLSFIIIFVLIRVNLWFLKNPTLVKIQYN